MTGCDPLSASWFAMWQPFIGCTWTCGGGSLCARRKRAKDAAARRRRLTRTCADARGGFGTGRRRSRRCPGSPCCTCAPSRPTGRPRGPRACAGTVPVLGLERTVPSNAAREKYRERSRPRPKSTGNASKPREMLTRFERAPAPATKPPRRVAPLEVRPELRPREPRPAPANRPSSRAFLYAMERSRTSRRDARSSRVG